MTSQIQLQQQQYHFDPSSRKKYQNSKNSHERQNAIALEEPQKAKDWDSVWIRVCQGRGIMRFRWLWVREWEWEWELDLALE